jgi:hypothetical protein
VCCGLFRHWGWVSPRAPRRCNRYFLVPYERVYSPNILPLFTYLGRLAMPISSELQLENLLRRNVPALSEEGLHAMLDTAEFRDDGWLVALYIRPLRAAPSGQIDRFFRDAGAFMGEYGDRSGGNVVPDHYPTSHGNPPCVPRDNWSCWVPANNPWRP